MSHKVIGNVSWVLCPGYPQVSGTDGIEQLTVKYTANEDGLAANLPEYRDFYVNSGAAWFAKYEGMRLTGRNIVPLASGDVFEVTLTYAYADNELPDTSSTLSEEWEYDTQDYDVPLAKHTNYCYCWNHKLAAKTSAGSDVPEWFETAANEVLSKSDAAVYKWLKPGDKCPEGYAVIAQETKAGVESFRRGITTVQWIKRCGNKRKLEKSAQLDYTIQTPKETFGKPKTGNWLRGGSKIRKNGKKWELTVSFLYSEDYDPDLYQ